MPSNGVLRELDCELLASTIQVSSGLKMHMSAGPPSRSTPASMFTIFAQSTVIISIARSSVITFSSTNCVSTRPSDVSSPRIPKGASANSTSFSAGVCGA